MSGEGVHFGSIESLHSSKIEGEESSLSFLGGKKSGCGCSHPEGSCGGIGCDCAKDQKTTA